MQLSATALLTALCLVIDVSLGVEGLKIPARDTAAATQPTVRLDNGAFVGTVDGSVKRFLGIPFALPPTGNRRFRRPAANQPYSGTHNASAFGPSCPQQASPAVIPDPVIAQVFNSLSSSSVNNTQAEDCLSLNIWAPANATRGAKLPVLVWIFGGGFENGQTAGYDGGVVVQRALDLGLPMIYVSMNYRLSLFGFLGGKEVKQAGVGNLGLHDQRQALRWIQRYISAFGGDTNKVTIWGESAGAISVASHMVAYGGNTQGLFHGAIMQSGSPIPTGDITTNQPYYDAVVNETGCAGATDTLQCLRGVSFASLQAAATKSPGLFTPQSLNLAWLPLVDGVIFTEDPQVLVQKGSVANIPFITGDCDDEGTLFTLALTNLTTNNQTRNYLRSNYLASASDAQVDQVLKLYPEDPIVGSPFDTGIANAVTLQYKRLAAFQGDLTFQAPRRFFLEQRSGKQNAWSFLFKRGKLTPVLGTYHSSDLSGIYDSVDGDELKEYIIRFAVNFDPNGGKNLKWPKYTPDSPQLMTLLDGLIPLAITNDTFRKEPMDFVTQLSLEFPLR